MSLPAGLRGSIMNTAASALVEVDRVRQLYPKGSGENLLVLDDVTLKLRNNEIVSLLGRSGCGKSSLLRIIAGLMPASEGKVAIGPRDRAGRRPGGPPVVHALPPLSLVAGLGDGPIPPQALPPRS